MMSWFSSSKLYHEGADKHKFLLQSLTPTGLKNSHGQGNIAVLNKECSNVLSHLFQVCFFEAYTSPDSWRHVADVCLSEGKDVYVNVNINIYGYRGKMQEVGDILNGHATFLQEPDHRNTALGYQNPHIGLVLAYADRTMGVDTIAVPILQISAGMHLSDTSNDVPKSMKQQIAAAFRTTTRAHSPKRITPNVGVRTKLKSLVEVRFKAL